MSLDGFRDMYNDFYGPADDALTSKQRREQNVRDKVRQLSEDGKAQLSIETEVETVEEAERKPVAVATKTPGDEPEKPKEPEKSGMEELNELVGLKTVKHDVEELIGLAKVRKMREEKGMKAVPMSLHLVFSGNPGTGKTTVARILGKLYKEIGILSTGQMIETDRSGLVAGYVGQTAIKTQKKIQEAMGGILFIDEAYMLNQKDENFGQEAIDTILKAMEDHRDEFIVIVAGYTQLMKEFVESNPGLKSRFNKFFEFPDYTVDELQQIFELQCKKYQYKLTEEADKAVRAEIIRLEESKGENFANAREVRNLFEKIIANQAARVSALEEVDEETLSTITIEDLTDKFEEEYEKELEARAAREAEIAEALNDVEEMNGENQQTAEERAGELVSLLQEMVEENGEGSKGGKKKKIKAPDKKPIIRR